MSDELITTYVFTPRDPIMACRACGARAKFMSRSGTHWRPACAPCAKTLSEAARAEPQPVEPKRDRGAYRKRGRLGPRLRNQPRNR